MAGSSLSMGAEVAVRVAAANAACAGLTSKVLLSGRLLTSLRTHVAETFCNSRLLFAAGAWPELPAIYARRLSEAHMRPLRRILLAHRPPAGGEK